MEEKKKKLKRKDLLGIKELEKWEIELILETAKGFKTILERPLKKLPTLRGKTILNLFFEPSTRTQASFDLAAKRLSADIINISKDKSSVRKGETLLDTLKNIEAMKIDAVIIRHWGSGTPHFLARHTKACVINAGDGIHEHPTQALLDIFTLQEKFGKIEGLKVLILGDILHSRVARSNIFALNKMGAEVFLSGPPTLLPPQFSLLGAKIEYNVDKILPEVDVVMCLRLQRERMKGCYIPSLREYRKFWGLTKERAKKLKKSIVVMHPGPVNWGVEIDYEVLDILPNIILEQVTNGVAIRMAVLYLLLVGEHAEET